MRCCLIFNPRSGTADQIKEFLLQLDSRHRCDLRTSSTGSDLIKIAQEAVEENYDRIVVAGGDGSISQVIQGIAPHFADVELAILPFGTGNDLARSLGLAPDRVSEACQAVFSDDLVKIDVIQITTEQTSYCINVANGGFGGEVAMKILPEDKKKWGAMAYWMSAVMHLADPHPFDVELELDGKTYHESLLGLAFCNGRFVGGGFPIGPGSMLNDGLLDVTTIPHMSALQLMSVGVNFALGRANTEQTVKMYRARKIHMRSKPNMPFSIDGELVKRFDATFEVLPQVLSVVPGPNPPAILD